MGDSWVRNFTVSDPQRHRKGFTVYKVVSRVYPWDAPEAETQIVVWKRYSEFQKLYKELKTRHEKLYLRDSFPPFVKSHFFGRFEADVIEERRLSALALLEFVAKHPPLFTCQSFVKFFEKGYNVHKTTDHTSDVKDTEGSLPPPLLPLPQGRGDCTDAISESSTHSTLTDTDSTISAISSPVQPDESPRHGDYNPLRRTGRATTMLTPPASPERSDLGQNISAINMPANSLCPSSGPGITFTVSASVSSEVSELTPAIPITQCVTYMNEPSNIKSSSSSTDVADPERSLCSTIPSPEDVTASTATLDSGGASPNVPAPDTEQDDVSTIPNYMTRAAFHVVQAVEYETSTQFEAAFASYKDAIACLLGGVQDDLSEARRQLVQNKAAQYLQRAEHIYHTHLAIRHSTTRTIPKCSPVDSRHWRSLQRAVCDLKIYKVLGVVSTVILALDTVNEIPYVIKVLHKTPCPVDRRVKSVIPSNVPFMCRLHCFMENEYAVFLVLEQACGGRLWDHISAYLEARSCQGSLTTPFAQFMVGSAHEEASQLLTVPDHRIVNNQTSSRQLNTCLNSDSSSSKASSENVPDPDHISSSSVALNHSIQPNISIKQDSSTVLSAVEENVAQKLNIQRVIPDVILQEPSSPPSGMSLSGSSDIPDVLLKEDPPSRPVESAQDLETFSLLENAQKLLESVNKTLIKSEKITKNMLSSNKNESDTMPNVIENRPPRAAMRSCSREHKLSATRDRKASASRDRKSSATRRPRAPMRFSCDDMFEGRARALSRSLDREALRKADTSSSPCLPVDLVRVWAAQILLALDALHRWGVVIGDLRPDNLLLGRGLNILLTYQSRWVCVDHVANVEAIEEMYAAPEVGSIDPVTPAADWWSLGAILFELLSGETLASCHPGGFLRHTALHIPTHVPEDAASLLKQLLRYEPQERLGAGQNGTATLKAHPFFSSIDWHNILLLSAST